MRVADRPVPRVRQGGEVGSAGRSPQYAALLEATDGSIITTGLDGTILSWDAAAEQMCGFSAAEAIGQPLSLIVPAARARETIEGLRSVAVGNAIGPLETTRIRRDKTLIDVSLTMVGVRDAENRVIGAMCVARDITASKYAERSLNASQAALADANAFLLKAEQVSRTGTWTLRFDAEWSVVCSPECYRVLGLADGTPITVDLFFSFVHPDDRDRVEAAMSVALAEHRTYEVEYRMVSPDGSIHWIHACAEPEYDEHGEPLRVLGVVQDITERHDADETLRESERQFRLLAENARDFIFRISLLPEPRYDYVSPAAFAITGYTTDELYARPLLETDLVSREHVRTMKTLFDRGALSEPIDMEIRRKDGTTVWVSQQLTFVHDDAGTLVAVEGIDRDITERKRGEDERAYASLHDPLTGLPNLLLLHEQLDLIRHRPRTGSKAFVVALDLDDFTLINDTHGRETGDAVLVAVADLLSAASTETMTIGRTGCDEFTVVGDDINGADVAAAFAERVQHELRRPIRCDGIDVLLRARIGVAADGLSGYSEDLLRDAEVALARAKRHRADSGIEFFDAEMRMRAKERLALVNDMYTALDRDQFELRYQPVVRLADDRIIGAEALLRWIHPQRGMVYPSEFIPLAEDTGLIVSIGAWVLNEACAQLRSWSDAEPALEQFGISVNLSMTQLRSSDIVHTVAQALSRAGIAPGRLTVEMTESVFAEDLDKIHDVLDELKTLGVRLAIDDFGTGYSSLAYLKHLPIDTIKIDKTFVDGLGIDARDEAIVASTLTVSTALGLFTVAEGVESADQYAALREMGCHAAQGFHMSKPIVGTDLVSTVLARAEEASALTSASAASEHCATALR